MGIMAEKLRIDLAQVEADILAELQQLATTDANLAINEATWLTSPLIDRTKSGVEGSESYSWGSWLNYWNGRRNSIVAALNAKKDLLKQLQQMIDCYSSTLYNNVIRVR